MKMSARLLVKAGLEERGHGSAATLALLTLPLHVQTHLLGAEREGLGSISSTKLRDPVSHRQPGRTEWSERWEGPSTWSKRLEKGCPSLAPSPPWGQIVFPSLCSEWPCQGCWGAQVLCGPESRGSPLSLC